MSGIAIKSKPADQVRADVPVHKVGKGETVRLNINIDKEERAQWKRAAIDLDTDVTTLVHEAVRKYLREHGKA
ncbi:MAG: hypothetical protein JSR53_05625 [Proteobacteria bacterium]|nr:hypothetical protein [Pseudomonadota bacterium]